MNIGKAIKAFRKASGVNQMVLAELAGITQTYLSLIESGERVSSIQTIEAIAGGLDIPVSRIYIAAIGPEDLKENACVNDIFMLETGKELILKVI
jgi:transcriptional regulator with XRE-family HTH domain